MNLSLSSYESLRNDANNLTTLFGELADNSDPQTQLATIKTHLDQHAQKLENQDLSPSELLVLTPHLKAYQALYDKKINAAEPGKIRPPKLMIVEDRLTLPGYTFH